MKRTGVFWPLVAIVVLTDCASKRWVEDGLVVEHTSHDVIEGVLRFTLSYNTGAAFSTEFGAYQRWILIGTTLAVLGILARLYRSAEPHGRLYVAGLALVCGGAIGNLLDRIRSARGVVDFIDIGFGTSRFYIFNIADVGITLGAAALACALWRYESVRDPGAEVSVS